MAKKETQFISTRVNFIEDLHNARTYLGKHVISKSGENVGRVSEIVLKSYSMMGVLVGRLFIDKEYIGSVAEDAVMLSVDPVTLLVGKQVFDSDGRKLGKVKKLERAHTGNEYEQLVIKRGLFRKDITVPSKDVSVSARNVILKRAYE